jgi:hypothetical protein
VVHESKSLYSKSKKAQKKSVISTTQSTKSSQLYTEFGLGNICDERPKNYGKNFLQKMIILSLLCIIFRITYLCQVFIPETEYQLSYQIWTEALPLFVKLETVRKICQLKYSVYLMREQRKATFGVRLAFFIIFASSYSILFQEPFVQCFDQQNAVMRNTWITWVPIVMLFCLMGYSIYLAYLAIKALNFGNLLKIRMKFVLLETITLLILCGRVEITLGQAGGVSELSKGTW